MERILYLGMPGSGKTTTLLNLLEEELKTHLPHEIAFVSFTRKAIQEAQERCTNRFEITRKEMPYFRTLHSMAFYLLGLTEKDMLKDKHLAEISQQVNIDLLDTRKQNPVDLYNLARSRRLKLFEVWGAFHNTYRKPFNELTHVLTIYNRYKHDNMLFDYTDLLEQYLKIGGPAPVKIAFVDEAQDLSTLQWEVLEKAFVNVETLVFAGDDDQCIYGWAGADKKRFMNFEGGKIILNKSYRCPKPVADIANGISARIEKRYDKTLLDSGNPGIATQIATLKYIEGNLLRENFLILVRNRVHMQDIQKQLIQMGLSFAIEGKPFCRYSHAFAISNYAMLKLGFKVNGLAATAIARCSGILDAAFEETCYYRIDDIFKQTPYKQDFRTQFIAIYPNRLAYYYDTMANGQDLLKPLINISTIHGAKGAECDNVIVSLDQSILTFKTARYMPDNEHRVFYVAVTRAKKNLFILSPQRKRHYYL